MGQHEADDLQCAEVSSPQCRCIALPRQVFMAVIPPLLLFLSSHIHGFADRIHAPDGGLHLPEWFAWVKATAPVHRWCFGEVEGEGREGHHGLALGLEKAGQELGMGCSGPPCCLSRTTQSEADLRVFKVSLYPICGD